jgi:hypothetical protein
LWHDYESRILSVPSVTFIGWFRMARVLLVLALSVCVAEAVKMKVERPRTILASLGDAEKKHHQTAKKFLHELSKAVASSPMHTKDLMQQAGEAVSPEAFAGLLKGNLRETTEDANFMLAVHEKAGSVCAFRHAAHKTSRGEGEEKITKETSRIEEIKEDIIDAQATYIAKMLKKANPQGEKITMANVDKVCASMNDKDLEAPTNPILKEAHRALEFGCDQCSSGVEDAYKAFDSWKKNFKTCGANLPSFRQGMSAPWKGKVENTCNIIGRSPGKHEEAVELYMSTIQDYLDDRHTPNPEVLGAVENPEDDAEWLQAHPPRPHYPSDKDHIVDTFPLSDIEETLPGGLKKF